MSARLIQRYSDSDRINHWIVAIAFALAGLSGLALFHPGFFVLSGLFGGGPWTRILHPFIGLVMFSAFVSMAIRFWQHNVLVPVDFQWLRLLPDILVNREDRLPKIGKYNAGQKLLFWMLVLAMPTLFVTGILFWRPWFAGYFPIPLIRVAALLHALAAATLILGILVHIYAAIWIKYTVGAMVRGTVSHKWARLHHPLWYAEMMRKEAAESKPNGGSAN